MTHAVNFTWHLNKTWGNIAGSRTLIGPACWIWLLKHFFWLLNVGLRNSTFNSNSGDTPRLRAVTLSFALTHFTFILDFRWLKTSVFGWNLCFSSTLNFWIAYFSWNDDLVSIIRDHFPNVNYLKSPNWCLDSIIGPCRRSYYAMHNVSLFVLSYDRVAGYFNKRWNK